MKVRIKEGVHDFEPYNEAGDVQDFSGFTGMHTADFNGRFCVAKRMRCGANGLQLNCSWLPLSDPSEMSRMQSTEPVLDISDGSGTIASRAVESVRSMCYVSVAKRITVRQAPQNARNMPEEGV